MAGALTTIKGDRVTLFKSIGGIKIQQMLKKQTPLYQNWNELKFGISFHDSVID